VRRPEICNLSFPERQQQKKEKKAGGAEKDLEQTTLGTWRWGVAERGDPDAHPPQSEEKLVASPKATQKVRSSDSKAGRSNTKNPPTQKTTNTKKKHSSNVLESGDCRLGCGLSARVTRENKRVPRGCVRRNFQGFQQRNSPSQRSSGSKG